MVASEQTVERLPRGRHGLSREAVVRAQRDRILLAMAETMTERGYAATTVAHIISRARVSRETFYQQFASKEACFAAAYERAASLVLTGVASGGLLSKDWSAAPEPRRAMMDCLLGAYLDGLAAESAYARVFLVEVYAAGEQALVRRTQLQDTFAELIAGVMGATTEQHRFACRALTAAISAMVTARIAAGDLAGLRELREPLLDMVSRSMDLYGPPADHG